MLEEYFGFIRKHLNLIADDRLREPDTKRIEAYRAFEALKVNYRDNWQQLLQELKESGKFSRVRDMDYSSEFHTFRAVLPTSGSPQEGCMLCISLIGNLIGIYYSDIYTKAAVPFQYGNCMTPDVISYYPFSFQQEENARFILALAAKHFPSFRHFENTYANVPVSNVFIGEDWHQEIDLFQAIFSTNVHVMI